LDASRIYNASSAQYTEDFSLVQSALSNTESALISQLSTEEKSLLALESQISALESQLSVSKSILTVLEATQALIAAQATASQLKSVDLRQTAMNTKRAVIDEGNIFGAQGEVSTQNILGQNLNAWMANAKAAGTWAEVNHFYDNLVNKWGFNSTEAEWLLGVPKSELLSFFGSYNLPAFAMGTNFVPEDMVAQIHQGERIIPAADNMELMASVSNRNKTNEILVAEIRKLNQKIDSLEKTVANGSIINAEATNRNTVEITNSVKDTKTTASYSEALRRRTQVV
jgi:cell division septum initiation protein DivIVA